jgi:putative transposase
MLKDTTVVRFRQPDAIDDPLTELAREGARRISGPGAGRRS